VDESLDHYSLLFPDTQLRHINIWGKHGSVAKACHRTADKATRSPRQKSQQPDDGDARRAGCGVHPPAPTGVRWRRFRPEATGETTAELRKNQGLQEADHSSGWFVFVPRWLGLSLFHIRSRPRQAGAVHAAGALAGQPPDTPAAHTSVRGLVVHRYQASIRSRSVTFRRGDAPQARL
jgi:hypothetical protein